MTSIQGDQAYDLYTVPLLMKYLEENYPFVTDAAGPPSVAQASLLLAC